MCFRENNGEMGEDTVGKKMSLQNSLTKKKKKDIF
jgi:hypothetical protein